MKHKILTILICSFLYPYANGFCQGMDSGEFMIVNKTNSYPIMIKMFPIGAIFNADKQYSPRIAGSPLISNPDIINITGIIDTLETTAPGYAIRAQLDGNGNTGNCIFAVGFGLYKIEFWKESEPGMFDVLVDTCLMDWRDANIGNYPSPMGTPDIIFNFYGDSTKYYYLSAGGMEIRIDNSIVNRHVKFWDLYGTNLVTQPWYPLTPSKGLFTPDNSSPQYLNYPIDCRDFGAPDHQGFENIEMNLKIDNPSVNSIVMKSNQKFIFKNDASLIAKNVTFNSSSGGTSWNGIKLENSGSDTIINCTFNNATTAISISNDYLGNYPGKVIKDNIINISQDNARGIDVRNQNKILIDNNTFNFSNSINTLGIFFRNSDSPSESAQSFIYSLNIVNNEFYNGYLPIYVSNLTSSRPPFYIYNNTFAGNNIYSIAGLKISGDIKNNQFDPGNINRSIGLWNSNPNVYGNNFRSISTNMYLNYSFPSASPTVSANNQLVWTGGRNYFNSISKENIFLDGSYPYLDRGRNDFTIDQTLQSNHLFGNMPDSVNLYKMTYNCWHGNNNLPSYSLFKYVNDTLVQIPVIYSPTYCIETFNPLSNIVTDMGAGIFDTVFVSNNNSSESPSEDEILVEQARTSNKNKNFPDAITNYKGLVDNFTGSSFIYTSLYEVYDNYSSLDTSREESETDVLFGDLKQYLNNKINSDIYDKDFNSLAFDIILMCETRMKNYEVALTGYEFIALFHPNADQKMLASWDYEEIESLTGGSGGGEKQLQIENYELQIEEHELKELNRLDKLIDDTPLLKSMKKNYEKINSNKKYNNNNTDKVEDEKIILRAKENIFRAKFMKKEEKEERFIEDMNLLLGKGSFEIKTANTEVSNLQNYKLNQNYPNPFNPTTKISFYIPFSNNVTLKVFDITGKQVRVLLNGYRQKGNHEIEFNGQDLSSGVYYYKLSATGESGSFIEIKKMVLIK